MTEHILSENTDPFLSEILEQAATVTASAAGLGYQSLELERLRALTDANTPIVLTGMGSSYDALTALSSTLMRQGRKVTLVNTAELIYFGLPMLTPETLVLAVSQSGHSAELVRLAELVQNEHPCTLVSVCNGTGSPLSQLSQIAFDVRAGEEVGPSTKSFTATLVVLSAIERVISRPQEDVEDVIQHVQALSKRVQQQVSEQLSGAAKTGKQLLEWSTRGSTFVFVGRGVGLAAAEVGGLIIKEAAHVPAVSLDSAEFRHGPLELAGPELNVVVVSLETATEALDERLVSDLTQAGTNVLVIGPRALGATDHVLIEPIAPFHDVLLATIPFQLLTWALARETYDVSSLFQLGSKVTAHE